MPGACEIREFDFAQAEFGKILGISQAQLSKRSKCGELSLKNYSSGEASFLCGAKPIRIDQYRSYVLPFMIVGVDGLEL